MKLIIILISVILIMSCNDYKKTDYNNGKLFFNCTVKVNSKDYDYDLIIRYQSKIAEYNIYELALEAVLLEALKWIK